MAVALMLGIPMFAIVFAAAGPTPFALPFLWSTASLRPRPTILDSGCDDGSEDQHEWTKARQRYLRVDEVVELQIDFDEAIMAGGKIDAA